MLRPTVERGEEHSSRGSIIHTGLGFRHLVRTTGTKHGQIIFNEHFPLKISLHISCQTKIMAVADYKIYVELANNLASHVYLLNAKPIIFWEHKVSFVSLKNMILISNNYTDQHFMASKVANILSVLMLWQVSGSLNKTKRSIICLFSVGRLLTIFIERNELGD